LGTGKKIERKRGPWNDMKLKGSSVQGREIWWEFLIWKLAIIQNIKEGIAKKDRGSKKRR